MTSFSMTLSRIFLPSFNSSSNFFGPKASRYSCVNPCSPISCPDRASSLSFTLQTGARDPTTKKVAVTPRLPSISNNGVSGSMKDLSTTDPDIFSTSTVILIGISPPQTQPGSGFPYKKIPRE